ncbi:hypothetical protein NC653_006980 [Populus alba x Populus x berolinensis]|uniref:Uncharacterized protein n=1 Tax=Populus alba x Populus x berolinensis TaxID=444605 RepID=A0AAD6RFK8_9ROSI|nr:hypothetical protein NC653_006980 [Populus alba x Populus x berolinensis]
MDDDLASFRHMLHRKPLPSIV